MEEGASKKRKVSLKHIEKTHLRNACFKKRRNGLFQKLHEITILCAVEACAIVFPPGGNTPPTLWPSETVARSLIERFHNLPDSVRSKRTNHRDYLQEQIEKNRCQVEKLKQSNDLKEMLLFMHQIYREGKRLSDFAPGEVKRIISFAEERLEALVKKITQFQESVPPLSTGDISNNGGVPAGLDLAKDASDDGDFGDKSDYGALLPPANFEGLVNESELGIFGGVDNLGVFDGGGINDIGLWGPLNGDSVIGTKPKESGYVSDGGTFGSNDIGIDALFEELFPSN